MRSAAAVLAALLVSTSALAHQAVDPRIMKQIRNDPSKTIPKAKRPEEGRRLFFKEQFGGNGRTCGTCHSETNNFTIDVPFINSLPPTDPLFVAEQKPELADLENSDLLRRFALIKENLDGFDQPGVMRGTPHTLALRDSRNPPPGFPLREALGWSGDGAPGTGTLREFAIGAVVQHFPKTLNRVPGVDFRLPTEQELQAMESFQLSLGRQAPFPLDATTFSDLTVELGKSLFNDAPSRDGGRRSCAGCHDNAGPTNAAGNNLNVSTGAALAPTAPACLGDAPGDGGFGQTPVTVDIVCGKALTFRGNRTFNVPPLVEAADTPPFFHNNAAATIEDAVAFYTSDIFNDSPAGGGRAFVLTGADIVAVGGMLRAINAIENIRQTDVLLAKLKTLPPARQRDTLRQSIAETTDAIEVLTQGPAPLFAGTRAVPLLARARTLQRQALGKPPPKRAPLVADARDALAQARREMVN